MIINYYKLLHPWPSIVVELVKMNETDDLTLTPHTPSAKYGATPIILVSGSFALNFVSAGAKLPVGEIQLPGI
jgi:hypothetical protein